MYTEKAYKNYNLNHHASFTSSFLIYIYINWNIITYINIIYNI